MFSLRVLLSFCLIFCQFRPNVAYKSAAYKRMCVFHRTLNTPLLIILVDNIGKPNISQTFNEKKKTGKA